MSNNEDKTEDHKSGYKKPPLHSRWKKGQSGNPTGRSKRVKNNRLREAFGAEFDATIKVLESGKEKKIPALQGILRQLVQNAAKGNKSALLEILRIDGGQDQPDAGDIATTVFSYSDAMVAHTPDQLDEAFYQNQEKEMAKLKAQASSGGLSVRAILHFELDRRVKISQNDKTVSMCMREIIVKRFFNEALLGDVSTFRLLQRIVPKKTLARKSTRLEILRPTQAELDSWGGTAKPRS